MSPSIHGHEVIEMILASQQSYTRASLEAAITARFGPTARFHTCSAEDMDAAGLVAFFAARGKFVGAPDAFTINRAEVCQH